MDGFVMKCGGSTLAELPEGFYEDLRHLQERGSIPVIVHGGGPAINRTLERLKVESSFVDGLRVTSGEVLDVVEMVLAGGMNKEIVSRLQKAGAQAVGLSGVDGHLLQARPVNHPADIGFVGEVTGVNATLLEGLIAMGYMPVIAPIGMDDGGQRYNINADTAAGAVASHLGTERLIVVTDVEGVMRKIDGRLQVLPSVTVSEIEQMITNGEIYGGMIPKVKAAMNCIHGRVREVVIVKGTIPQIISRVLEGEKLGTRIIR